jgi:hypothetical protein
VKTSPLKKLLISSMFRPTLTASLQMATRTHGIDYLECIHSSIIIP